MCKIVDFLSLCAATVEDTERNSMPSGSRGITIFTQLFSEDQSIRATTYETGVVG